MLMQVAIVTCDYDNIDAFWLLLMNRNQEDLGHQEIPSIGRGSIVLSRMTPMSKMASEAIIKKKKKVF